eukprot:5129461-Amphidinium_carterae.3
MWQAVLAHISRLDSMEAKPAQLIEGKFNSRAAVLASVQHESPQRCVPVDLLLVIQLDLSAKRDGGCRRTHPLMLASESPSLNTWMNQSEHKAVLDHDLALIIKKEFLNVYFGGLTAWVGMLAVAHQGGGAGHVHRHDVGLPSISTSVGLADILHLVGPFFAPSFGCNSKVLTCASYSQD